MEPDSVREDLYEKPYANVKNSNNDVTKDPPIEVGPMISFTQIFGYCKSGFTLSRVITSTFTCNYNGKRHVIDIK